MPWLGTWVKTFARTLIAGHILNVKVGMTVTSFFQIFSLKSLIVLALWSKPELILGDSMYVTHFCSHVRITVDWPNERTNIELLII